MASTSRKIHTSWIFYIWCLIVCSLPKKKWKGWRVKNFFLESITYIGQISPNWVKLGQCKFRNFEARNYYNPSNERSWAALSKKYKFISARIYRKKVTAHRKLQKVRKSQKCLDRNARQIAKNNLSPKNFMILNKNILGY